MAEDHVLWVGIDPNLLLEGLDTKALLGCDNYLKFNLNSGLAKLESKAASEDTNRAAEAELDETVKMDPDVKEEVLSSNENSGDEFIGEDVLGGNEAKLESEDFMVKRDHSNKDRSLKCDRCKKTFRRLKSFQRHKRLDLCVEKLLHLVQPSTQPALCPECGVSFENRSCMIKHLRTVHKVDSRHKEKNYHCDQCEKAFPGQRFLDRHVDAVHNSTTYACEVLSLLSGEVCNKMFTCEEDRNYHAKTQHSETTVQCPSCSKMFVKQRNLDIHIADGICEKERKSEMKKKRRAPNAYMCNICGKGFRERSRLEEHILWKHEPLQFDCDQCPYKAPSEKYVVEHKAYKHEGKGPMCDQCNYVAKFKAGLKIHLLNVHGVGLKVPKEPVVCPYQGCNKIYSNKVGLSKHIMQHTGERPYKCDYCEKAFIQKVTLQEHVRVHTGEKPFKCSYCDKAFTQSSALKSHMKDHMKVDSVNSPY